MIALSGIYPTVRRHIPSIVPKVEFVQFPQVLLNDVATQAIDLLYPKDTDFDVFEILYAQGTPQTKAMVEVGIIEFLQAVLNTRNRPDKTRYVEESLGPTILKAWNAYKARWTVLEGQQIEASLSKGPRSHPKLPNDLTLTITNNAGKQAVIQRDIWRTELPFYQRFFDQWEKPVWRGKQGWCPKCQTHSISRTSEEFCLGYTVTSQYADRNFYYKFDFYLCENCNLGWTQFVKKRTWSDVSYP